MKRTFIVALTALAVISLSCTSLLEPEYAENSYVKGWIFRKCIDDDYRESCAKEFAAEVYGFSTSPQTLQEACLAFLAECTDDKYWEGSYEECRKAILEEAEYSSIDIDLSESGFLGALLLVDQISEHYHDCKIMEIFQQDPEAMRIMLTTTINEFFTYIENLAQGEVKMLNWTLNEDALADTYTGYFVEYEIGSGFYALLDLVEYDNENRCTFELVYSGNSLTELHQHYE